MTHRELLELAAKSICLGPVQPDDGSNGGLVIGEGGKKGYWIWSPDTDGHQALELAVELNMVININGPTITINEGENTEVKKCFLDPSCEVDRNHALRCAIVECAAKTYLLCAKVHAGAALMDTDKMREQFEAAFAAQCERKGYIPRLQRLPDGSYEYLPAFFAWWAWQASRADLAVTLPPLPSIPEPEEFAIDDSHMDGFNAAKRMRERCALAVEAAGLGVVR